jgi:hypothetical protein
LSEPSEPEPHRVTAPAPTKRCGSLRLRLRNTGWSSRPLLETGANTPRTLYNSVSTCPQSLSPKFTNLWAKYPTRFPIARKYESMGMWWLSWLRQLGDTRLLTQWSRVRIRHPSQSPEQGQAIKTVSYKQVSGWEASLPEQKKIKYEIFPLLLLVHTEKKGVLRRQSIVYSNKSWSGYCSKSGKVLIEIYLVYA